jgi:hypothetical protein
LPSFSGCTCCSPTHRRRHERRAGRIVFGALYGLSTVGLYAWLGSAGLPTFYDKLLQVPLLNLSVKTIDWAVRSTPLGLVDPARAWRGLAGRPRNLAYVSVWGLVFLLMSAVQGVGDSHRGQWLPFWQRACGEGPAGRMPPPVADVRDLLPRRLQLVVP